MRSGATTLWVADHHLLQTHTTALRKLLDDEGQGPQLVGIFKTLSEGRDPGTPNCFLFPLPNGAWRVYRFSPGIAEADTWTQDGQGWTTCYFNRYPDLETACTLLGRRGARSRAVTSSLRPTPPLKAAKTLGEDLTLPNDIGDRKVTLKTHKDGRLVVEIERTKEDKDKPLEGWDDKKGKYVKIFKVQTDSKEDDELDFNEFDHIIRAVETAAVEHAGWVMKKREGMGPAARLQRQDGAAKPGSREERGRGHHGRRQPHEAGGWSTCPSARSTLAAGSGTSTPRNSSSSPPN